MSLLKISQESDLLPLEKKEYTAFHWYIYSRILISEYIHLIPVLPLLLHYIIVINFSSNCEQLNETAVVIYLFSMHVLTFITSFFLNIPFERFSQIRKEKYLFSFVKSFWITFQFFTFSLLRAKPYKCLLDLDPTIVIVLSLLSNGFSFVIAFFTLEEII